MGIAEPSFYRWKKQFAGMGVVEIRRVKPLEDEPATELRIGPHDT
jgi:putative transposase